MTADGHHVAHQQLPRKAQHQHKGQNEGQNRHKHPILFITVKNIRPKALPRKIEGVGLGLGILRRILPRVIDAVLVFVRHPNVGVFIDVGIGVIKLCIATDIDTAGYGVGHVAAQQTHQRHHNHHGPVAALEYGFGRLFNAGTIKKHRNPSLSDLQRFAV